MEKAEPTPDQVKAHLLSIGFEQRSKSVYRHGPIEVRFTDAGLSVSFWDKETAVLLNAFAEFVECEIFKVEGD